MARVSRNPASASAYVTSALGSAPVLEEELSITRIFWRSWSACRGGGGGGGATSTPAFACRKAASVSRRACRSLINDAETTTKLPSRTTATLAMLPNKSLLRSTVFWNRYARLAGRAETVSLAR